MATDRREREWRKRIAETDASSRTQLTARQNTMLARKAEEYSSQSEIRKMVMTLALQHQSAFNSALDRLDDRDLCNIYIKLLKLAMVDVTDVSATTAKSGITNLINTLSVSLIGK